MEVKLTIQRNNKSYEIAHMCKDSIQVETHRSISPGLLRFQVVRELAADEIEFYEGDGVSLELNGVLMFWGYIFSKSRDKDNIIEVTAYDQLRYFKNKDTYIYCNKRACDVLRMIAMDFKLNIGVLEDSEYVIDQRVENNQKLVDIINNAIELTYKNKGILMVVYDDGGYIQMRNVLNMKLPFMLAGEDTGLINYKYSSDINEDTYNKVKLYKRDDRKGLFEVYVKEDTENQNKWGVLQYYEKIDGVFTDGAVNDMADEILKNKNRVRRTLETECICNDGEENIRAGNMIWVRIGDLGDTGVNEYMVIEDCTHIIRNSEHRVKLRFGEI